MTREISPRDFDPRPWMHEDEDEDEDEDDDLSLDRETVDRQLERLRKQQEKKRKA